MYLSSWYHAIRGEYIHVHCTCNVIAMKIHVRKYYINGVHQLHYTCCIIGCYSVYMCVYMPSFVLPEEDPLDQNVAVAVMNVYMFYLSHLV